MKSAPRRFPAWRALPPLGSVLAGGLAWVLALLPGPVAPAGAMQGSDGGVAVLFVGNSFTYGGGSAVQQYRSRTVSDLNGSRMGGVPALVKSFTQQAGLGYDVAIEAHSGANLDFHAAHRMAQITSRHWDHVLLQGYSTLDAERPGDAGSLVQAASALAAGLRQALPQVRVHLVATWPRADQVYRAGGAWAGRPIEAMALDLRAAYDQAAAAAAAAGVVPVGQAWNRAIAAGVADANPYDGIERGKLNLWAADHYHASVFGSYLMALVIFGHLTGIDPRTLGAHECSAFELGIEREQARALQRVAFEELAAERRVRAADASVLARQQAPARCVKMR